MKKKPKRWTRPPHYSRWEGMISRCYAKQNPRYKNYGGRGIKVCPEWLSSKEFLAWCNEAYIKGRTLDRIDNNGDYTPDNCRWATTQQQQLNRNITKEVTTRTEKKCPGCGLLVKVVDYPKNKARYDGLHVYCFPCTRNNRAKKSLLGFKRRKRLKNLDEPLSP